MQGEIEEAAFRYTQQVEKRRAGRSSASTRSPRTTSEQIELHRIDPEIERRQLERTARVRAERDAAAAAAALARGARGRAAATRTCSPPMREALAARCTVGEICGVLREEWGTYDAQRPRRTTSRRLRVADPARLADVPGPGRPGPGRRSSPRSSARSRRAATRSRWQSSTRAPAASAGTSTLAREPPARSHVPAGRRLRALPRPGGAHRRAVVTRAARRHRPRPGRPQHRRDPRRRRADPARRAPRRDRDRGLRLPARASSS